MDNHIMEELEKEASSVNRNIDSEMSSIADCLYEHRGMRCENGNPSPDELNKRMTNVLDKCEKMIKTEEFEMTNGTIENQAPTSNNRCLENYSDKFQLRPCYVKLIDIYKCKPASTYITRCHGSDHEVETVKSCEEKEVKCEVLSMSGLCSSDEFVECDENYIEDEDCGDDDDDDDDDNDDDDDSDSDYVPDYDMGYDDCVEVKKYLNLNKTHKSLVCGNKTESSTQYNGHINQQNDSATHFVNKISMEADSGSVEIIPCYLQQTTFTLLDYIDPNNQQVTRTDKRLKDSVSKDLSETETGPMTCQKQDTEKEIDKRQIEKRDGNDCRESPCKTINSATNEDTSAKEKSIQHIYEILEWTADMKCSICGMLFQARSEFELHILYEKHCTDRYVKMKNGRRYLQCPDCKVQILFEHPSGFMLHLLDNEHDQIRTNISPVCNSNTKTDSSKQTISTVRQSGEVGWFCKICRTIVGREWYVSRARQHITKHHTKKLKYRCKTCYNFLASSSLLHNHKGSDRCKMYSAHFTLALKATTKDSNKARVLFQCNFCVRRFLNESARTRHEKTKHVSKASQQFSDYVEWMYDMRCLVCNKVFQDRNEFRQHIQTQKQCIPFYISRRSGKRYFHCRPCNFESKGTVDCLLTHLIVIQKHGDMGCVNIPKMPNICSEMSEENIGCNRTSRYSDTSLYEERVDLKNGSLSNSEKESMPSTENGSSSSAENISALHTNSDLSIMSMESTVAEDNENTIALTRTKERTLDLKMKIDETELETGENKTEEESTLNISLLATSDTNSINVESEHAANKDVTVNVENSSSLSSNPDVLMCTGAENTLNTLKNKTLSIETEHVVNTENVNPFVKNVIKYENQIVLSPNGHCQNESKDCNSFNSNSTKSNTLYVKGGWYCKICEKVLGDWAKKNVMRHIKKYHTKELCFNCKFCGIASVSWYKLNQHIKAVHGESDVSQYPCSICGKLFKSENGVRGHERRVHAGQAKISKDSAIKKRKYVCSICDKAFAQSGQRDRHARIVHKTVKDLICEKCGHAFKDPEKLKKHDKWKHTEFKRTIKFVSCTICDKSIRKPQMWFHMQSHKDRKIVCDICQKKFVHKHHLKNHMVVHTGKRSFICQICGFSFNLKHHLDSHLKTKHSANLINE